MFSLEILCLYAIMYAMILLKDNIFTQAYNVIHLKLRERERLTLVKIRTCKRTAVERIVAEHSAETLALKELLYNTLFSREDIFAKNEFEIFSRIYCSRENIFPRKFLPAKISSRENIFPRKYLPAYCSRAANM